MGRVKNIAEKKKKAHIYSGGSGGGTKGPEKLDKRNEEKPCPYCDRTFKQVERLRNHIKTKHQDEENEEKNDNQAKTEEKKSEVTMDVGSKGGYYTQKTPKMFLHEWCQKHKRPTPKYRSKRLDENRWTCKVVLLDPKDKDKTKVFYLDKESCSEDEACQSAAVKALHGVAGDRAMHRVLPKAYVGQWEELNVQSQARQVKQERREAIASSRKKREDRIKKQLEEMPEVHLSEENRNLIAKLVKALSLNSRPDQVELTESHQKLIQKFKGLGFGARDSERAVQVNSLDYEQGLEWLCLHVQDHLLPKQFAPLAAPVTVVSSKQADQGQDSREQQMSKEARSLVRLGYPLEDVEEALELSDSETEVAFRILYCAHVLSRPVNADLLKECSSGAHDVSPEWLDEKEVLQSIYMDEFVDVSENQMRISCSLLDETQGRSYNCVLTLMHPIGTTYPEEPPLIQISAKTDLELDPRYTLDMTKRVAHHAQTLKGMCMIHDIVLSLSECFSAARKRKPSVPKAILSVQEDDQAAQRTDSIASRDYRSDEGSTAKHRDRHDGGKRNWNRNPANSAKLGKELLERQSEIETRHKDKLQSRRRLPVSSYAQQIVSVLVKERFCVICGETGCGKSTQIPQFLLEHEIAQGRGGECSIICTQPRRISAIGLAERVASERGERVGDVIGYSVRLDSKTSKRTRVTFCTTGILLRRLVSDRELSGITHVIVDEVHERSLDSDMLLLLLKEVIKKRKDLKIAFMSATANAEAFQKYFRPGTEPAKAVESIVSVPGKMFPVQRYFLEDAHRQLGWQMSTKGPNKQGKDEHAIDYKLIENLVAMILNESEEVRRGDKASAILVFLPGMHEIVRTRDQLRNSPKVQTAPKGVFIVPLHSTLTPKEQSKVYQRAPAGQVKVILSTNIAETSITVDDVVFIIDAGRVKELLYDSVKGIAMLKETWISKASAKQRMGRAGRVMPGTCWHLFSESRFHKLAEYQAPEILRVPLDMLCLKVKACMKADLKRSLNSMLTPPNVEAVDGAISKLLKLQAIDEVEDLTPLGRILSEMPVDACVGKLLIYGVMLRCTDPILTIAASMSGKPPFISPQEERTEADAAHSKFHAKSHKSDHLMAVTAFNVWQTVIQEHGYGKAREYCRENYLSFSALEGIESLRIDYARVLLEFGFISSTYCNEITKGISRMTHGENHKDYHVDTEAYNSRVIKSAVCSAYYPSILRASHPKALYKETEVGAMRKDNIPKRVKLFAKDLGQVFLHPASSLFSVSHFETGWLVYSSIMKTTKIMVRDCSSVPSFAVLLFGGDISVDHSQGTLIVDEWAQFKAPAKVAVLVRELRNLVNDLLWKKVENPRLDVSSSETVDVLLRVITMDGQ